MSEKQCWVPLESNPDVMNKFLDNVGVPETWRVCDVYGLDQEILMMVPQPALSVLLLFPMNDKFAEYFKKQEEKQRAKDISPSVYFMKQTIGNACGTVALIHALANNVENIELKDGYLKKFLEATKDLSSDERAAHLETDAGLCLAHEESAQEGQTEAPSRDEKVELHFITLVARDGSLYELDGQKSGPINHGSTTPGTFLEDAAAVCRRLMAMDPEELRFTVMALAAA